MRTSEILALQQHQQQLQKMKHQQNNSASAAALQFLDPLYPTLLPGSVRDAWSALVRSARPLPVLGGMVEEEEEEGEDAVLNDIDLADLVAKQSSGSDGAQHSIITAAMIEKELAKEKKQVSEEYTLHSSGRLSVACRTKALHTALVREGELMELLETEAKKVTRSDSNIWEVARKEVEDMTRRGTSTTSDVVQQLHQHHHLDAVAPGNTELMNSFYARLNDVKRYHTQAVVVEGGLGGSGNIISTEGDPSYYSSEFPVGGVDLPITTANAKFLLSGNKRKHGHPIADGYDIASYIATDTSAVRIGEVYTPEELYGLYLDLVPIYEEHVRNIKHAFAPVGGDAAAAAAVGGGDNAADERNASTLSSNTVILSYIDFLSILSRGLNTSIPESAKLRDRRKYVRFLRELEKYLTGFLKRTSPFLDVMSEVVVKAVQSFDTEWSEKGGVDGWECRLAESSMVSSSSTSNNTAGQQSTNSASVVGIDLSKYANSSELEKDVSGDELKSELARLGLKCGGTVADRAARLFLTKDTPMDKLPAKIFAKKAKGTTGGGLEEAKLNVPSSTADLTSDNSLELVVADRRVDIARLEAIVTALLDQLRPTLEGTRRRVERRMTQTENERDQEIEEAINGTQLEATTSRVGGKGEGGGNDMVEDDDSEDDTPIYNPKNVPLGWDGKPIPYWLFKLHGLNHFYPCELCGNESYRGIRNFEKHFTESRHSFGMRCLGIPNTKHFHGVTKIADALELWGRLRKVLEGNQFDVDQEEEYEDSHGNVVNRAQYEDLARQGLL
jgi:splicing factor 3A subunit 3